MRVLNLYAGLGGNRKLWQDCQVTAVEMEPDIADVYRGQHPKDTVIIGDAHQYLLENHTDFDFVWSSPPCQTHSKMQKATRHDIKRYPDMALYQEIIFLTHFFKGRWVVENVRPYYDPLIPCYSVGRHLFWSNFPICAQEIKQPRSFITEDDPKVLMRWLGIYYDKNIYYKDNHCPSQVLRNCVHPELGLQVFNCRNNGQSELSL